MPLSAHARLTSLDTLTDAGTRRASARGVEIRARRHTFTAKRGPRRRSVRPALAGGRGRRAAPGRLRDRPRRRHEGPAHPPDLARCAACRRVARDDGRLGASLLCDPEPRPVGCARPRRDLRARPSSRRELPRPGRPGRADVTRLVRLGARRAHDGLDRAHDRLRPHRSRGRDRAARPRLEAGARRPDPPAAGLAGSAGGTRGATTSARSGCRNAGARRRHSSRRRSAVSGS